MPIRIKLLVLLLTIALPPLFLVTWLDQRATRQLGLELADRSRAMLEGRAAQQLLASIRGTSAITRAERERLEVAVQLQAREIERALAQPVPQQGADHMLLPGRESGAQFAPSPRLGGLAVTWQAQSAALAPGVTARAAAEDLARLGGATSLLAQLRYQHAETAAWQHVALPGRVQTVFPGYTGFSADGAKLPAWVEKARQSGRFQWSGPLRDAATGMVVATVAAPVYRRDGSFAGATAIDVPIAAVLDAAQRQMPSPAHALIVTLEHRPDGSPGIWVVAEQDGDGTGHWLEDGSEEARSQIMENMAAGRAGVKRLIFRGQDALWAFGSIDDYDTHLLFIIPYAAVVAEALRAEDYVSNRIDRQRQVLLVSVLLFVPLVVALALAASRHVTRPIQQLSDAAHKVMAGDFEARTAIRSGDELQDLGRLFNIMVPQIEERMHMRQSLALAQQVQQNLMPHAPPQVPGFDIAGLSISCDETGGDYFDYFALPELGPDKLVVAVGDVAGHGVPAALLMTTARALLRSRRPMPGRLGHLVNWVNRQLASDTHAGRFMTLFFAVLSADDRNIHWVGAGHEPALIYDPVTDAISEICGQDIPLAIDPEWNYHEISYKGWNDGAVMIVGTDGIRETRNAAGEMFGKERLVEVIRAHAQDSAQDIACAVTKALAAFRHSRRQGDDITLVVIKAVGS